MEINNYQGVYLYGGLGNQLFHFFAGMSQAIDKNKNLSICLIETGRKFYFNMIFKKIIHNISNYNNLNQNEIYQDPSPEIYTKIPENSNIIKGYFQSYKYFIHNYDKIIDILEIRDIQKKCILPFKKTIAIHFRLSDYLQLQHCYYILQPYYYLNAINELKTKIDDINDYTFIIFSEKSNDEIINQYLEIMKLPFKVVKIYDIFPNIDDDEELIYMSNCDHFIIANSTYSLWGAYLSNNENKLVLYPSKFCYTSDRSGINYFYPDSWIKINIEP
jgi:hypothetical protein